MLTCRNVILRAIRMFSQLNHPMVPLLFSEEALYLQKNPCHNLVKNQFFQCYKSLHTWKMQYQFIPFSHKSLNLQKNCYYNLLRIQFFYSSRPRHNSELPLVSTPRPSGFMPSRISRTARTEAQDVLFEYLHGTRSLDFLDAEHISKNSPTFIENLLSKVRDEEEVTRSLTRFLRYHPINEYEPFLESLGVPPSELPSVLPRDHMFLSDDDILLENFHVLCNYGIPRSKIGKIYKEEPEIFKYYYGVLPSKLRAYEELGLCIATVIKLVICCPALLVGGVNGHFSRALEKLKGIGIESDWIRGRLLDSNMYNWSRMYEMMCFLDGMGYNSMDMGKLFKSHTGFLFEDSGKKIYIFVALLLKVGLEAKDIFSLFLHYPWILAGKFMKNIWELVIFLTEIGMEKEDVAKIIRTDIQILGNYSLRKPATVMSKLKVSAAKLCEIIKEDPLKFIGLASRMKGNSLRMVSTAERSHNVEKNIFLKSIGYVENSEDMVKALNKFRGRGDQLQERFDCLVNAGLDCHVVSNMIKAAPPVLNQSKEVIEMKIDYLVNYLNYPLQSLVGFPTYLCYDIDKIKLRFSMYMWLREEGIAKPMLSLSTILACSDTRFVKYFVNVHPKGPSVWESLKNSSSLS